MKQGDRLAPCIRTSHRGTSTRHSIRSKLLGERPRTKKPKTKLGGLLNIPHGEQVFQSLNINNKEPAKALFLCSLIATQKLQRLTISFVLLPNNKSHLIQVSMIIPFPINYILLLEALEDILYD